MEAVRPLRAWIRCVLLVHFLLAQSSMLFYFMCVCFLIAAVQMFL